MVRFIRDFILKGSDREVFTVIQQSLPHYMKQTGEYTVQSEIHEGECLYRKAIVHTDVDTMIPRLIREKIPPSIIDTVSSLIEEQIFDNRLMKIQWSITPVSKSIYTLSGNIRFISLDGGLCKIVILIYLEWNDVESIIPDTTAQNFLLPLLEKQIPDMCLNQIRHAYTSIVKNELV
jgi:hypothetical protein